MKLVLAAIVLSGTFVLGYWLGVSRQTPVTAEPQPSELAQPVPAPAQPLDTFQQYVDAGDWFGLITWLDELRGDDDAGLFPAARTRLLKTAEGFAAAGKQTSALGILRTYVDFNPQDNDAQFLLSDLYQTNGEVDLALEPLFEILEFPTSEDIRERARKRLELLIGAKVQRLGNSDDLAALVGFYERLSAREPSYDRHRLGWARWLARSGDLEAAKGVLKEVGSVGVTADEVTALERELELADSGLELIRNGNSLHVEINISGRRLVMLVDTGATVTGIRRGKLAMLGAAPLGRTLRVLTAAGPLDLDIYRVREFVVGNVERESLDVLALENLPKNVDGLLGMDIIKDLSSGLSGSAERV
ncbi:MAG: tetratricopeptide repeat protein, partial [Gammaproteobacteria bacterium]|nr:tetratricopeptide repeat protein [Gammaproteobacteria bacterium]